MINGNIQVYERQDEFISGLHEQLHFLNAETDKNILDVVQSSTGQNVNLVTDIEAPNHIVDAVGPPTRQNIDADGPDCLVTKIEELIQTDDIIAQLQRESRNQQQEMNKSSDEQPIYSASSTNFVESVPSDQPLAEVHFELGGYELIDTGLDADPKQFHNHILDVVAPSSTRRNIDLVTKSEAPNHIPDAVGPSTKQNIDAGDLDCLVTELEELIPIDDTIVQLPHECSDHQQGMNESSYGLLHGTDYEGHMIKLDHQPVNELVGKSEADFVLPSLEDAVRDTLATISNCDLAIAVDNPSLPSFTSCILDSQFEDAHS